MKTIRFILIIALGFLFLNHNLSAQSAKKIMKSANKSFEEQNFDDALLICDEVIKVDSTYGDAYFMKAKIYAGQENYEDAKNNFALAIKYDHLNSEVYLSLGRLNNKLDEYEDAVQNLSKSLSLDKKNTIALQQIIIALAHLKQFDKALNYCNLLLDEKKSYINYYMRGVMNDSLGSSKEAELDYQMAISYDYEYAKSYYAISKLYLKNDNALGALEYCEKVINLYPEEIEGYWIRSEANHAVKNYELAINDLSKIDSLKAADEVVYFRRANYYNEFSQNQNAINDYSKVISLNDTNYKAYYLRAKLYDEISDKENAILDYTKLTKLEIPDSIQKYAKDRLYDLKREQNLPELIVINPEPFEKRTLRVKDKNDFMQIEANIKDESDIEYVKVNDKYLYIDKNEDGVTFVKDSIEIIGFDNLTIYVSDVYHNEKSFDFNIQRTEIDPPLVTLISPYASFDGEIYLTNDDPELYIEGSISDESLIKEILVDGLIASYRRDEINPTFSTTVEIADKDSFKIVITDIYDNVSETNFRFNREGINLSQDNPMGKTWVVFIENSNYESFASLEGPTKDVISMKGALANYQIHNVIHKRDMTKMQLEKFFAIDLRDLVKQNHVNSLLVWYAGHGKFLNETGYWIPVNAVRDDEFTYFNINSLKASMQSYSDEITHVLIVSDACESGPSFYQAMRSAPDERTCDDTEATKFKSSQVFSSAGYELAADNSQFSKTFAKSLSFNENTCLPIETIVTKVTEAVEKNNSQKPQFGKIQGFEDENGTFFFMRKEE